MKHTLDINHPNLNRNSVFKMTDLKAGQAAEAPFITSKDRTTETSSVLLKEEKQLLKVFAWLKMCTVRKQFKYLH